VGKPIDQVLSTEVQNSRNRSVTICVERILLHVDQIRDGASVWVVSHGWEVFVERLEAGIDLLGSKNVETFHKPSDQIAERVAGNGGSQTGSGRRRTAARWSVHGSRTLTELLSLELSLSVLEVLVVVHIGR